MVRVVISFLPSSSYFESGVIMDEVCRVVRLEIDWPLEHDGVLANCVATVTTVAPHRKRPFCLAFEDAV